MRANEKRALYAEESERLNSAPVRAILERSVKAKVSSSAGSFPRTMMIPLWCDGHKSGAVCYFFEHSDNGWEFDVAGEDGTLPQSDVYSFQTHYVKCARCGREYRVARERLVKAAVFELGRQLAKASSDFGVSLLSVTKNSHVR